MFLVFFPNSPLKLTVSFNNTKYGKITLQPTVFPAANEIKHKRCTFVAKYAGTFINKCFAGKSHKNGNLTSDSLYLTLSK